MENDRPSHRLTGFFGQIRHRNVSGPLQTPAITIACTLKVKDGRISSGTATDPFVFAMPDGSPYRSIRSAFQTDCRRAGLTGITPHTLRHSFGSRLAMSVADMRTIQEVGGWCTLGMVERYSHPVESRMARLEKTWLLFHSIFHNSRKTAC